MPVVPVNYVAILVAGVFTMVLGFLWYGPIFGKQWMHYMGFTHEHMEKAKQKGMAQSYIIMIITTLLMSYVLAHALIFASSYMEVEGPSAGLAAGFWNWLGFIVPVSIGTVLWEGKSWKLWVLNAAYYLVALLGMGVILALWM